MRKPKTKENKRAVINKNFCPILSTFFTGFEEIKVIILGGFG